MASKVPAPAEKSNVVPPAEPISVLEVVPDLPTVTANVSQKQSVAGVISLLIDIETSADIQENLEENDIKRQPEYTKEDADFTLVQFKKKLIAKKKEKQHAKLKTTGTGHAVASSLTGAASSSKQHGLSKEQPSKLFDLLRKSWPDQNMISWDSWKCLVRCC
ncbi:Uncharacterized protein Fot_39005 [Forsythia ovata]|uniref:Uncharacterized protein n=1 Tax=Forsythia ovata TaxID=205694 RepID=A0ABD1S5U4_9LAMI